MRFPFKPISRYSVKKVYQMSLIMQNHMFSPVLAMYCVLSSDRRTYVLTSIILLILIGMASAPVNGQASDHQILDDLRCEVILNREDITYSMDPLDEMVEEGKASILDPLPFFEADSGMIEPIDDGSIGWTTYILRAKYDDDLAVMISDTDETWVYDLSGSDITVRGLSVSLIIPSRTELMDVNIEGLEIDIEKHPLNGDLEEAIKAAGYTRNNGNLPSPFYSDIIYRKGEHLIGFRISPPDENETLEDVNKFIIQGPEGTLNLELMDEIRPILDILSISIDEDDLQNTSKETVMFPVEIPETGIFPEEMNWEEAMREELERLVEKGILSGLTVDDMEDISSDSTGGRWSANDRIIWVEDEWKPYRDSAEPYVAMEGLGSSPIHAGDLPNLGSTPGNDGIDIPLSLIIPIMILAFILILILAFFGYTKAKGQTMFNNANRTHIFDLIKEKPGIHFREILRELDIKQGVLSYHINFLEKKEYVRSVQDGIYRRFYLFDQKIEYKLTLTAIQQNILMMIERNPGITQTLISRNLGKNRMVINYHISLLSDAGIVEKEREGRVTHCYLTSLAASIIS